MKSGQIGMAASRVDGRAKVTGQARYAAEFDVSGLVHAVVVRSTIACGSMVEIDVAAAMQLTGVIAVLTHQNTPKLPYRPHKGLPDAAIGERLHVLQDERISHQGQPLAVVVAQTLEQADSAARLVKVQYVLEAADTDFGIVPETDPTDPLAGEPAPEETIRGDCDLAMKAAGLQINTTYSIPREYHNPIEPHATIARWEGSALTLWDKTQWVHNVAEEVAAVFGIEASDIRVISPFVGGAFGSAARVWSHVILAALAAKIVDRPVKIVLTRREMYYATGYRPQSRQTLSIGASRTGQIDALRHEVCHETSTYEEYKESLLLPTQILHSCPNLYTRYRLSPLNVHTPTYMRGPGEASGLFALESAIDELATQTGIDPVQLRFLNEPPFDQSVNLPFSSRSTRECYRLGAERFGWDRRDPRPGSMTDGQWLIGWGMASGVYPVYVATASARAQLFPDGRAEVSSAASDMGPGTYTSMTQVAAQTLGLSLDKVLFKLGDNRLPRAPIHSGSMTMASVGSAVKAACERVKAEAIAYTGAKDFARALEILDRPIDCLVEVQPGDSGERYSMNAFSAIFTEVGVDRDLGEVRVRRMVGAYGAGLIVNPKIARSQCVGGMIGGIGMALMEHAVVDKRTGRVVNANFAEYAVPVHADCPPDIDVIFVDEEDHHVNSLGVKGIGELAMAGIAPAIANAVYHATGKRIRNLPITPDTLL